MTTPDLAPPNTARRDALWETVVCTDDRALQPGSRVAAEWDGLWRRAPQANPFQHRAWLGGWWAAYGRPGVLRLVLVRREGVLMGAVALYTAAHDPLRRPRLVGEGLSDYGDVLVRGTQLTETHVRLAAAVAALRRPVDLREVPPDGAALDLAAHWPSRVARYADSPCLWLPARCFQDIVGALPQRIAAKLRAKSRRLDRLGVQVCATAPDQAADAVGALLRLHEQQWQGRRINPEHLTERFGAQLRSAVPELIAAQVADLLQFRVDGELPACELLPHSAATVSSYLNGVSPQLRRKADIATLMAREGLRVARERGASRYALLRGNEPYKLRWQPGRETNTRLLLGSAGSAVVDTSVLAAGVRLGEIAVSLARPLRERARQR
jgi:CelD/BcsL family acetyltransferase involved in cellulose biosynthesis